MHRTNELSALLFALSSLAHAGGSGLATNTGLTAEGLVMDGPAAAFVVDEAKQGLDLNGDGDLEDHVLHVDAPELGDVLNTGLALTQAGLETEPQIEIRGRDVLVDVSESKQGGADLNGDGDAQDGVLFHVNLRSGAVSCSGSSVHRFKLGPDYAAFSVLELMQGAVDLNGDGDVYDAVLHTFDLESGRTHNLGLAAGWNAWEFEPVPDRLFATVSEKGQGEDLDRDGQLSGHVLAVHDVASGATRNLGCTATGIQASDDYLLTFLGETDEDFNGDRDLDDQVLHAFDVEAGIATNTELDVADLLAVLYPSGDKILTYGRESLVGDLNGDGDESDYVTIVHDLATGETESLGIAAAHVMVGSELAMIRVNEAAQGEEDLDGDGHLGFVAFAYDVRSGVLTNLQESWASLVSARTVGQRIVMAKANQGELASGGLVVFDMGERRRMELPNASPVSMALSADRLAYLELERLVDLNGDGDKEDAVLHTYDFATGETTNHELASMSCPSARPRFTPDGTAVLVRVSEYGQGQSDLNGDGSIDDWAMHVVELP